MADHYTRTSEDRANDTRLVTPLVLIALIIAGGFLYSAYHGNSTPAPAQHAAAPAPVKK